MGLHNYSEQKFLAESPEYHPHLTPGQSMSFVSVLSGQKLRGKTVLTYMLDGNDCPGFLLNSFIDNTKASTYRMSVWYIILQGQPHMTYFQAPQVPES